MRIRLLVVVALGAALATTLARGNDWPQFRGPGGSAASGEKQLPAEWSAERNVIWKAKIAGYGWSSPIVWGDKVFVTTAVSDKQKKPSPGFGGGFGGFGGGGGPGGGRPGSGGAGRGGFGGLAGFGPPAQLLPSFLQGQLKLSDEQKKQVEALQKEVDGKLAKILTADQNKQLKDMRAGPGGLSRPGGGPGGFGGFPGGGLRGGSPPNDVYRFEVHCLDRASGKEIWHRVALEGKPRVPTQQSNTYASETPVTDGERVYAYFGMHGVYCYDFDGNLVWKADLGSYPTVLGFGTGSSPALADGRLFIQCDNEEKSFLVALEAKTGHELWRKERPERTGWSTPLVWKNQVRTEVVCLGSPKVRSYDPASGEQLGSSAGIGGQAKASPAAAGDSLFVGTGGMPAGFGGFAGSEGGGRAGGSGGGKPLVAVKAGASGDITLKGGARTNDGIAWSNPQGGPATASPLSYEGYLYILEERGGIVSCYDAHTGKQAYKERLPGAQGFTSSPWAYAGKVFCLDDAGTTHVVQAGTQFKVLGKNAIPEMCWASPAVAGGALYLRTVDFLYCIKA